jgi:hypothetical protein
MILGSRKYDPGCSSPRIRILTFYPSRIPDPGVKNAQDPIPDPESGSATLVNTPYKALKMIDGFKESFYNVF